MWKRKGDAEKARQTDASQAATAATAPATTAKQQPSLLEDLGMLLLKITVVILALVALFIFVFGAYRVADTSMEPVFKDGDLVIYYRLDRHFVASELAALEYNGKTTAGRVVATAGDTVDIDAKGLKVNGNYQQEKFIYDETTQVADGVTFPLTVPEGSVFLLGDNRDEAIDSRIYGCVNVNDVDGKVMAQFRRRGF